jgi:hypothetical protein
MIQGLNRGTRSAENTNMTCASQSDAPDLQHIRCPTTGMALEDQITDNRAGKEGGDEGAKW